MKSNRKFNFMVLFVIFGAATSLMFKRLMDIEMEIPSIERCYFYENTLQEKFMTPLIEQFGNVPQLQSFLRRPQIYENLLFLLDQKVLQKLENVINTYFDHVSKQPYFSKMTKEAHVALYIFLIHSHLEKKKTIGLDIDDFLAEENLRPFFENLQTEKMTEAISQSLGLNNDFEEIINDYLTHYRDLFTRLIQDWNTVTTVFLKDSNCELINVSRSEGERHKIGGGVSILTFFNNQRNAVKIVYKTSSVLVDMAIMGQFAEIKKILFENSLVYYDWFKNFQFSFAEIVNSLLIEINPKSPQIPVYKILPMEDISNDIQIRIRDAYGYIEFLEHGPETASFSLKSILTLVENKIQLWNDKFKILEKNINYELDNIYIKSLKEGNYGLNSKELNTFWYQVGLLTGLIYSVFSIDAHFQNLVVSKKAPYLIDLENSLIPNNRIKPGSCFLGSESPFITTRKNIFVKDVRIENEQGKITTTSNFESDGVFSVFNTGSFFYNPYREKLNPSLILEGLTNYWKILKHKNLPNLVDLWLNSDVVKKLLVRVVPIPTPEFQKMLLTKDEEIFSSVKSLCEKELFRKSYLVFDEQSVKQLQSDIVPSYYMSVDKKELFHEDGSPVLFENNFLVKHNIEIPSIDTDESTKNCFYNESSLNFISLNIENIKTEQRQSEITNEVIVFMKKHQNRII